MRHHVLTRTALSAAIGLQLLMAHSTVTHAQMSLEEVVVTAQKRDELQQDIPISLVSMGSAQIENLRITDIIDLGSNVPNLQLSPHPNSGATPRVFIRGVGNFDDQITQDPSVAVYMDGVYVGRNQGMGLEVAELERIEVLRGPQGTLYGRNATGGAINFITQAPELGQWGFKQDFTFGKRDEFRSRTMVNAPIGDTLAVRAFYMTSEKDGFVDNAGQGTSTYGAEDRDAQRIDFFWQPNDALDARYSYDRSQLDDTSYYLAPTVPGVPPQRPSVSHAGGQTMKPSDVTAQGHQLTVNWEIQEDLILRSITAYRDLDSYVYQDYLSGTGRPNTPFFIDASVEQDQFSQELQLIGSAMDYKLDYTLGLYYFEEEGSGSTINWLPGFGIRQVADADIENKAWAAFGQATYTPDMLDSRLHLTLGLRWSKDERKADLTRYNVLLATNGILAPSYQQGRGDKDFDAVNPSFTVGFDLTNDINLYAKYAEGYKTGGFNVRATTIAFFENGFDEESLESYEIGIKSQWLENRLRVNAAVFTADYKDIQLNAQTNISDPTKADILNAGEATIQGLELEVTALVVDGLTASFNYGYLNARYDEINDAFGRDVTNDYEFVNAPQHSYTLDLNWDVTTTPYGVVVANLNYTWQDDKFITATRVNGDYTIDDYGLLNARIALEDIPGPNNGVFKVALWGRNLEDKEYSFLNAPGFGTYRAWGEPRSYGVDLSYEF